MKGVDVKNKQRQSKKSFSLKDTLIIAIVFILVGAFFKGLIGDLFVVTGEVFFVIWIVRGVIYLSKENKKDESIG